MDDAVSERIIRMYKHLCFSCDKGATPDRRENPAFGRFLHGAFKNGVEDSGLLPNLSGLKSTRSMKAGKLGTGAGATG